jgi:hypothetical protein
MGLVLVSTTLSSGPMICTTGCVSSVREWVSVTALPAQSWATATSVCAPSPDGVQEMSQVVVVSVPLAQVWVWMGAPSAVTVRFCR